MEETDEQLRRLQDARVASKVRGATPGDVRSAIIKGNWQRCGFE
ncbi:hypothetical protein RBWH47_03792 [Rhodopirellula baltica WH47]|uniref:Uncharacterized protein n=2 Tax=Rhodopirellula baltica TaxID=265606 RepID=F2ANL4_RHOBT|nr:hypothetical protein RBWH47_03792 [Rhodopirellula baltica WH47]ELP29974.1 hypothetical protein RBSWK_06062 [Rhodopirellula baltica SWK14]